MLTLILQENRQEKLICINSNGYEPLNHWTLTEPFWTWFTVQCPIWTCSVFLQCQGLVDNIKSFSVMHYNMFFLTGLYTEKKPITSRFLSIATFCMRLSRNSCLNKPLDTLNWLWRNGPTSCSRKRKPSNYNWGKIAVKSDLYMLRSD